MSLKNLNVNKIPKKLRLKLSNKKIQKLIKVFEKNFDIKETFIVAVSGGSDSLALAFLTKIYAKKYYLRCKYFIVDHKLRKESTAEAEKVKKILEIGIGTNDTLMLSNMGKFGKPGASLKAYRDYFKKSRIYGADIDKKILFKDKKILTKYVDQTDHQSIRKLFKSYGDRFDLIIDDGLHSHIANLNLFIHSLKFLKKGGCFVIEDISLKSKTIWLTISTILNFKHKCFLIKCRRSYVFLIYK